MTRAVVPIASMNRRLPEAGRIRIGVKTGNSFKAIDTFRFTSPDRAALQQVADTYGGTVKPWSDPKAATNQFEVITEATEIRVVLPPNPLGNSPIYEMWGGKGCERRCDGETCTIIVRGPEGPEPVDRPCLCDAAGALKCDPKTRLNVLLPEVRFTGVWRLESKSENVAQEMPGFVDLICSLQERGLTRGVLRLEHRRSIMDGDVHKFVVPVLGVDETVDALAAGAARFGGSIAGASSTAPALGPGSSEEAPPLVQVAEEHSALERSGVRSEAPGHASSGNPDDDVVDHLGVDDGLSPPPTGGRVCARCHQPLVGPVAKADGGYVHKDGCPTEDVTPPASGDRGITDLDILTLAGKVFAPVKETAPRGRKSKVVDECRYAMAWAVTNHRATSLKDMTPEEKHRLWTELTHLEGGFNTYEATDTALTISHDGQSVVVVFADMEGAAA